MSLLRYWTTRYLITLLIGLAVVAIASALWIRHTTIEHRLDLTVFMAEQLASRMVNNTEERWGPSEEDLEFLKRQQLERSTFIVNTQGRILSANRMAGKMRLQSIYLSILEAEEQVQRIQLDNESRDRYYVVKAPIQAEGVLFGWVVIIQPEAEIRTVNQEYKLLLIMLASLALLGWAAIYFLSKKLSSPIKDVVVAAKEIQEGNYNIQLSDNSKEQEVYELVHSFKEMASRLQQLETLRTELLAGVTHELKTPVTSISGLLQAIKDDVVSGEEAKEFLAISLKETAKMQKMVEDLLAFNSFAANKLPIIREEHELNDFMREMLYEWEIVQDGSISYQFNDLSEDCFVQIDSVRLQQIIVNLLGNAKQAIEGKGTISMTLVKLKDSVAIDVKDNGRGIPEEEQGLVFERFYRGENKKYKVRGLGLGLPLSKMIAQALGGDLVLKGSSEEGTTFRVTLPVKDE